MKKRTTSTLIAFSLLVFFVPLTPAVAQQVARPTNDYGVLSKEVVKQRLKLIGQTQITQTVETASGYRVMTMQNGLTHTFEVDGKMGGIIENGRRVPLPSMVRPPERTQ